MEREVYVGIDPGAKGYVCVWWATCKEYEHCPIADTDNLKKLLREVAQCYAVAAIESVHSMPRQGVSTTFTFGKNYGIVLGMLMAYGIPYVEVAPRVWQMEMWSPGDKILRDGKVDTKLTSYSAARRLHPSMVFKRTERCKTFDDNKVDATLLCDYARRKNL